MKVYVVTATEVMSLESTTVIVQVFDSRDKADKYIFDKANNLFYTIEVLEVK